MFNGILDMLKNVVKSRFFALVTTYILLFSILVGRMFYLQIVKGETYDREASLQKQKIKTIKSARGKIYDCNGKLLVTNEQSYSITIEDSGDLKTNQEKNTMIEKCITLIEKHGDSLDLDFPISMNKNGKFKYTVNQAAQLRFKREIFFCKSIHELTQKQKDMTAEELFRYIRTEDKVNTIHFFDKDETYTDAEALPIMTVRYALLMNTYSKYDPITLSSNVSDKTVAAIKENSADLPGVEVTTEMNRVYKDSKYFSHIIGYTGLISSETLAEMKESDPNTEYTSADQIGKTGIEKEYEDELKGKKGSETLVIDSTSRVVSSQKTKDAVAGKDIYLTIDSDLQEATYRLAEKQIAGITTSKLINGKGHGTKGKDAKGILISIYDVYDAIIQNSIVDVSHFNTSNATSLEKSVYQTFSRTKKSAINRVKKELRVNNKKNGKQLSETTDGYLDYIFSMLKTNQILNTSTMDTTDTMYNKYVNNKISLSQLLVYGIKNNWINLDNLEIDNNYYSSEEVFQKLVSYIVDEIQDDSKFDKKVYHSMVDSGVLSGREICLLLYDQKVLKMKTCTYQKLQAGMISPYSY